MRRNPLSWRVKNSIQLNGKVEPTVPAGYYLRGYEAASIIGMDTYPVSIEKKRPSVRGLGHRKPKGAQGPSGIGHPGGPLLTLYSIESKAITVSLLRRNGNQGRHG
jgi:hypothetical protein